MPTDNQISGAAYPMKIGAISYRARTLSDKDYDELNAWTRWKFVEESKASIDKMPLIKEDRQEMLTSTMLAASVVTFNSAEGSRIINRSTEGFARLGWQMVQHYHPNINFEEFLEQVKGSESKNGDQNEHTINCMSSINDAFIALNISDPAEDVDSVPENKVESDKASVKK